MSRGAGNEDATSTSRPSARCRRASERWREGWREGEFGGIGGREDSESTSVTDELENAMPACACFVSASASLAGRSVIMHTNGSRTVTDVTWQRHTCGCCIQSRVPLPTMLRGARQSCADTIASCLQVPREPLQIVMRTWYAASHTPASTLTSSLPGRWCCSHLRTPVWCVRTNPPIHSACRNLWPQQNLTARVSPTHGSTNCKQPGKATKRRCWKLPNGHCRAVPMQSVEN